MTEHIQSSQAARDKIDLISFRGKKQSQRLLQRVIVPNDQNPIRSFLYWVHSAIELPLYRRSLPPRILAEVQTQLPGGAEESHLDRPFRGIQNLAHTLQLHALEMPQVKNQPLSRGKPVERPGDLLSQLLVQQLLLGIIAWSLV